MKQDNNFDDKNNRSFHARLKAMIEKLKSSLIEKEASIRALKKENNELRKANSEGELLKKEIEAVI